MGQLDNTGKFISFILRHHPEVIGIKLDEHGWACTKDLISGIAKSRKIRYADVGRNCKNRFQAEIFF